LRVYLSGPIKDATDEEAHGWRDEAIETLERGNVKCLNPMRRDYREDPCAHLPDLVENDKIDIEMCDIILVNFIRPSVGTSMEILHSWERGKRVIVVCEEYTNDAWLVYHSHDIFRTLEEAYEKIFELRAEYEHLA